MWKAIWTLACLAALAWGCSDSRDRGGFTDAGGGSDGGGATDGGSGDAGGGTDAGGTVSTAWRTYCETTGPERATTCGTDWDADETPSCLAFAGCTEPLFRDALDDLVAECLGSRDCETNEDLCFAPEGLGATPSAAAQAYNESCLAKRSACIEAGGESFSDDFCYVGILNDATIEALEPCLEEACADVRGCVTTVVPRC